MNLSLENELPVNSIIEKLRITLTDTNRAVIVAPPGSGKTTIVPIELMNEPWLKDRKIIMLEPRRLAARNAAHRMSSLLNENPGERVGYSIRFDRNVSKRTRVEVVTEGILTRRIQNDPSLEDTGLIIFDEYHERNLQTDLSLALSLETMEALRPDLRILVMSATIDAASVSLFLNDAPVIETHGTLYPVEIVYTGEPAKGVPAAVMSALRRASTEAKKDIIVFLPGAGEQRKIRMLIEEDRSFNEFIVHTLHGSVPYQEQIKAIPIDPDGKRKIVLSTNIAESSLTISGVDAVIDSGLARFPRFDPSRNLTGLVTKKIALDSADQRAGRAGRLGPGICYRLWHPDDNGSRGMTTEPEIKYADLVGLALELALRGSGFDSLKFPDPPPEHNLKRALETLVSLGALDQKHHITDTGKQMASIPAHPAIARIIVEGIKRKVRELACDIGAILSERDPFSDIKKSPGTNIVFRLEALENFRRGGNAAVSRTGASPFICQSIERTSALYRSVTAEISRTDRSSGSIASNRETTTNALSKNDRERLSELDGITGELLAVAFPDRVSRMRKERPGHFLLASGKGAILPESDQLASQEFIVAVDVDSREKNAAIRLAAPITRDAIERIFSERLFSTVISEPDDSGNMKFYRTLRFEYLELTKILESNPDSAMLLESLQNQIRQDRRLLFPLPEKARALCERAEFLRLNGFEIVSMNEDALFRSVEDWLLPFLSGIKRITDLSEAIILAALETRLGQESKQMVDREAPEKIRVPSGSNISVKYENGDAILPVKLQELFGLADSPRIAGGRPIKLHLLSPAGRPIQITSDLKGFWERTYPEVRKELRGKYPKHPWPEDPWTAEPTRKTKRHSN